jgi:hypothetical protein
MTRSRTLPVPTAGGPGLFVLLLSLGGILVDPAAPPAGAQELPAISERTEGMEKLEGFLDLYWEEDTGKMYWEINDFEGFIYQVSMGSGLGSNPVNIDRGQLRGTWLLEPRRFGPKVLLWEPNYRYQARSDDPDVARAARDAFAPSVHWGFEIIAQTGEAVLVDATDFLLRDARGAARQMRQSGQGNFALDESRSAFYLENTRSFPENTEVETILTFTSENPGQLVSGVAASGEAVTLREHHSFVKLPEDGYQPRVMDPRVGANGPTILDFASPIDTNLAIHWVARHRLEKRNPDAARSEPVEPIIYYVDRGIPEPILSATLEGARWWNEAFEAAGYINAFRVEVLPEGADPNDVRYNMIHYTHRRTLGYSYGGSVVDPRTGEIVKGNVNMGSLRLRKDYLLAEGAVPPFPQDQGMYYEACGLSEAPDFEYLARVAQDGDGTEMALARWRQLTAHEIGHTLGFPHNYLTSALDRESVMDYPAPLIEIQGDDLTLSNAYVQRIGEYDKLSVRWLYGDFPDGTNEREALGEITEEVLDRGLLYMGHTNNNFRGAGHQFASVWDNGANLVDHLEYEINVRRLGLQRFGPEVIRRGEPMSTLEAVLFPLYMHHRFQLTAAVQSLGGADYRNAMRGDGQTPYTIVPAAEQRRALEAVLSTLAVDFLTLPERIVEMIPPPAYRRNEGVLFDGHTGLLFDPIGAAESSAGFTVENLLYPERMGRIVLFGSMGDYPNLEEVVDRLVQVTWDASMPTNEYRMRVLHAVQRVVVDQMMTQAGSEDNSAEVRAILSDRIHALANRLEGITQLSPHQRLVLSDIRRWENRLESTIPGAPLPLAPGDPIGGGGSRN